VISGAPPFNDSTAVLTGSWGSNQTAQATVAIDATDSSAQEEVELRLNSRISANSISGYEFDCSVKPGGNYCIIVRWNGPLNSFCYLSGGSTCGSPVTTNVPIANGDVLKATNVGGSLTLFKNGTPVVTASDSTYTGGSPGIGFWQMGGVTGDLVHFGFSDFWATDGVPVITTTAAINITSTSAASGGTVVSSDGASVISEGVCYASTANPTTPCTSDGTATPFTSSLLGLAPGTTYHYRAFAANNAGIGYGIDLTFSPSGVSPNPPSVVSSIVH